MCGIVGKVSLNHQSVEITELKKMADTIIHRGPDGEGYWVNNATSVGFGHRRLSILDLSNSGSQPMHLENLSITYNGEIYNYIEIKNELLNKGYKFKSNCDTEVILTAYLEYGEDCLSHFDGMFAFAIWDDHKKELFAARDRFGEKPFYYYLDGKQFVFASEMKAIFANNIPKVVSDEMIFYYLTYDVIENPHKKADTFYKKIHQLPPSHQLKIDLSGEVKISQYWDINTQDKNLAISEEDAIQTFQELFFDSITKRLRSDVKVGSSFSGGIDSSSVVASTLKIASNLELNTFTARFKDKNFDEGNFIKYMTDQFDFKANFCWPESSLVIDQLDNVFHHQEEPFGSTSILAQWEVMRLAKDHQVTVLLDGQGADETLAGYYKYFVPYLSELYSYDKKGFNQELKAIENNLGINNLIDKGFYLNNNFPNLTASVGKLLRPFRLKSIAPDISKDLISTYKKAPSPFNRDKNLNDFLYFDTFKYGLGKLLRFSDRSAMAFSREVRLPYLSHKLVEFSYSLPSNFKMRNGWSKYILRKSMEGNVPNEICWRKDKKGFQAPDSWMKDNMVKELINDSILNLKKYGIIDTPVNTNNWKYIMITKLLS